ncbi:MAG: NosD domain-containing protein [Candidatus Thorarchaeota archaeon]
MRRKLSPTRLCSAGVLIVVGMLVVATWILTPVVGEGTGSTGSTNQCLEKNAPVPSDNGAGLVVNGDQDFVNWSGSGTEDDPYVISSLTLTGDNYCIKISYTTAYFVIYSCRFIGASIAAVLFRNVTHGMILNCTISHALRGVYLFNARQCTVYGNNFLRNSVGVVLRSSDLNRVAENRIHHNGIGINVDHSKNNTIVSNVVVGNGDTGVSLIESTDNRVYRNEIGWNGASVRIKERNAVDTTGLNQWDDGVRVGNKWSDYEGPDTYAIPGNENATDRFPSRLTDFFAPILSSPPDETVPSEPELQITWTASDKYPYEHKIFLNGTIYETGDWYGETIVALFGRLQPGIYNITVEVTDCARNRAVDTVIVTVLPRVSQSNLNHLVYASALSAVLVAIGLVILKMQWNDSCQWRTSSNGSPSANAI